MSSREDNFFTLTRPCCYMCISWVHQLTVLKIKQHEQLFKSYVCVQRQLSDNNTGLNTELAKLLVIENKQRRKTLYSIKWKQKISILTMIMFPHIFTVQSSNCCSNIMSQYQCTTLTQKSPKKGPHPCNSLQFTLTLKYI